MNSHSGSKDQTKVTKEEVVAIKVVDWTLLICYVYLCSVHTPLFSS